MILRIIFLLYLTSVSSSFASAITAVLDLRSHHNPSAIKAVRALPHQRSSVRLNGDIHSPIHMVHKHQKHSAPCNPQQKSPPIRHTVTPLNCHNQLIEALESYNDKTIIAQTLNQITQNVFSKAKCADRPINTHVEDAITASLDIVRITPHAEEFIFHTAFIDRIICDIEEQTSHTPTLIERSPKLLAQALTTFVKRLNPVSQIKNTCEFLIGTAHFVADVTLGKVYLSEQQYNDRINGFWSSCEALSPSNLAQLEAEQWIDLIAQCAADAVFFGGISKAVRYLREVGAVNKAKQQATHIAQKLTHAIDVSLAEKPLIATAEGLIVRATDDLKQLGGATKEVITNSKALLESACNGLLAELEKEMAHLRMLFDGKVKGFAEFSNKWMKIDYMHILGIELMIDHNNTLKLSGFHHDLMNAIEKSNVFKFTNKIMHPEGFYSADLIVDGIKVPKTFFPAEWPREKVVKKIYEAYANFIASGIIPKPRPNGKYLISGITREDITIEMWITKKGKIATAYPKLK